MKQNPLLYTTFRHETETVELDNEGWLYSFEL